MEYKQHFLNTVSCAVLGGGIRIGVGFYRWVKILIGFFLREKSVGIIAADGSRVLYGLSYVRRFRKQAFFSYIFLSVIFLCNTKYGLFC